MIDSDDWIAGPSVPTAERPQPRKSARRAGPLVIEGTRGWPMPDCSGDRCPFDLAYRGWLPWAYIGAEPDWYIGLYSCDHGHIWTCGYAWVAAGASATELVEFLLSPERTVPPDDELRRAGARLPIVVNVIDWTPLRGGRR